MVKVKRVGKVMRAVVEKHGIEEWLDYAGDLLVVAAGLRKICSLGQVSNNMYRKTFLSKWQKKEITNEMHYKEILKALGFHFTDYGIWFLISARKRHLKDAVAFLDSCESKVNAKLAKKYKLEKYFEKNIPKDQRYKSFEMGHVLGYPPCCVRKWFLSRLSSRDLSSRMIPISKWPEKAKIYSHPLVPWGICSCTCTSSIEYAEKAIEIYSRYVSLPEKFANPKPIWGDAERLEHMYRVRTGLEKSKMPAIIRRYEKLRREGYDITVKTLSG